MASKLRVVNPDEPAPVEPAAKRVGAAAKGGDRLELLVAMRDRIAKAVESDDTPPRDLASLSRRLQEIAKEIDVLKAAKAQEEQTGASREDQAFDRSAI